MSALEIAAAVRAGERSAAEVLDESIAAIEAREPELHAFNLLLLDEARSAAAAVDAKVAAGEDPGLLAGVPVALKDNLCTRGIPTTCSSRILDGWRPPYDATVVQRLAAAGAISVGKTNLDEFAMGSSTENSAFGPTRNPHDTSRVPGGSSGGSAVAVAAGMVPISLGSDTGGSIRQPAALCGVVGLKPTYGLVSRYGLVAFASSLDQIGPFSNTVADAALTLEVIGGHDPADSTSIPEPLAELRSHLDDGVAGLRIGIVTEFMGEGIAADVAARVQVAADALRAAGAGVEEASVPVEAATTPEMYDLTRTAGFGDEVKRRIMLGTYALSAGYYDAYYGTAQKVRALIARDFDAAYRQFDLLLSPTSPTTAFPLGDKTADPMTMYMNDVCTIPTNLAGHPAISVPFGVGSDGLPVGVQLLAPALGEVTMFRGAAVLEAAAATNATGATA